jgi:hypothetical protein
MANLKSMTEDYSIILQDNLLEHIKNTKKKPLNYPRYLERTSRLGTRDDFLKYALELFSSVEGPVIYGSFFGGMSSHITFRSHDGKIYSWIELLDEKEDIRIHTSSKLLE